MFGNLLFYVFLPRPRTIQTVGNFILIHLAEISMFSGREGESHLVRKLGSCQRVR